MSGSSDHVGIRENGVMEKGQPIQGFEDLQIWQLSMDLGVGVFHVFESSRNFSLRDQIQRADISISSNIAEGYERGSNNEFIQFLYYAKGSCGEVRSQLQLAIRARLISEPEAAKILADAKVLSAKLGAYINVRKTRFS